jgi:hypothetical protein
MDRKKRLLAIGFALLGLFAAIGISNDSLNFFGGIESSDNFLSKSIQDVEKDAQKLTVEFTDEEARGLLKLVADVRGILSENSEEKLLKSDLQQRLIRMEKEWKKKEGAWIVVRLLEGIRIKSQLYLQNAYLLRRLSDSNKILKEKTLLRMQRYLEGVEVSTDALENIVEEGTTPPEQPEE